MLKFRAAKKLFKYLFQNELVAFVETVQYLVEELQKVLSSPGGTEKVRWADKER